MRYNIKGTGLEVTGDVRGYVEKRLRALDKFTGTGEGVRADVEVEFLKDEEKQYRAEIMVYAPGAETQRVEVRARALFEAVDIAVGEMSRELDSGKKKQQHLLRRTALRIKNALRFGR